MEVQSGTQTVCPQSTSNTSGKAIVAG